MKRKHIIVLALLGLLSIVVLAVPELGILPMLVIIGIPISIAYWSVPALFLIATISYVIYHAMGFSGRTGALLAVSLSGILLAIPAYMLNLQIEKQAFSHVSHDHNSLTLPLPLGKIAVATEGSGKYAKDSSTRCDGFCLHALLRNSPSRDCCNARRPNLHPVDTHFLCPMANPARKELPMRWN